MRYNLAQLARTVLYLKFSQIYRRLTFRLTRPKVNLLPAPHRTASRGNIVEFAFKPSSMPAKDSFVFLNVSGTLRELGWDCDDVSKLWRYNQHYFDDLNAALELERFEWHRDLIANWIETNLPSTGVGWEPYPTSLRIVNWIKWDLKTKALSEEAVQSLAVQVRWLVKRLEWHLLGNHLFANAKALVCAGLYFDGPEADSWLLTGLQIIENEFSEQILEDGGHFELSPMYHAIVLEDVLDLINFSRHFQSRLPTSHQKYAEDWDRKVPAMLNWMLAMCHPDGQISFFNDATLGITPKISDLMDYAQRLGFYSEPVSKPVCWLRNSGFVKTEVGPATLICDIAKIGPDYLPGHAHADTLSFELSLNGCRLVVNSGISEYGTGLERLRQRSTAAHSTVVVDGANSSEVWSGFRVGRRARISEEDVTITPDGPSISASHDGYRYLQCRATHQRKWRLNASRLIVTDTISGIGAAKSIARFHLAPDIEPKLRPDGVIILKFLNRKSVAYLSAIGGVMHIESSTWHPAFGVTKSNYCVCVSVNGVLPHNFVTTFRWKNQ